MVISRSVPTIRTVFSPTDSIKMLESTGIVDFFSTIPCTNPSSFLGLFALLQIPLGVSWFLVSILTNLAYLKYLP